MKEYRYKINGNLYKVTVGDIEDNNVRVEVNGTPSVSYTHLTLPTILRV